MNVKLTFIIQRFQPNLVYVVTSNFFIDDEDEIKIKSWRLTKYTLRNQILGSTTLPLWRKSCKCEQVFVSLSLKKAHTFVFSIVDFEQINASWA